MKNTLKKRIAQRIAAAAMAFVTVSGTVLYRNTGSITAHAACDHHCRHYSSFGSWVEIDNSQRLSFLTLVKVSTQLQTEYDTCSNCGYKKYYASHCRLVTAYYKLTWQSGFASVPYKETIELLN